MACPPTATAHGEFVNTSPIPARRLVAFAVLFILACLCAMHAHAQTVWDTSKRIIFQDDFHSGSLKQWIHTIEDQQPHPVNSDRINVVPDPGRYVGNAVRFDMSGKAGTWRTELALRPAEN